MDRNSVLQDLHSLQHNNLTSAIGGTDYGDNKLTMSESEHIGNSNINNSLFTTVDNEVDTHSSDTSFLDNLDFANFDSRLYDQSAIPSPQQQLSQQQLPLHHSMASQQDHINQMNQQHRSTPPQQVYSPNGYYQLSPQLQQQSHQLSPQPPQSKLQSPQQQQIHHFNQQQQQQQQQQHYLPVYNAPQQYGNNNGNLQQNHHQILLQRYNSNGSNSSSTTSQPPFLSNFNAMTSHYNFQFQQQQQDHSNLSKIYYNNDNLDLYHHHHQQQQQQQQHYHPQTQQQMIQQQPSQQGKKRKGSMIGSELIMDEALLLQNGQKKKPKAKKKRTPKIVDPNAPPKPKRKTGLNKPLILSPALSELMDGDKELSRPELVQKLWKYIKGNDLQDPADRRYILCDAKLKNIFDQDRINSFGMNKDLSAHLTKKEEPAVKTEEVSEHQITANNEDVTEIVIGNKEDTDNMSSVVKSEMDTDTAVQLTAIENNTLSMNDTDLNYGTNSIQQEATPSEDNTPKEEIFLLN